MFAQHMYMSRVPPIKQVTIFKNSQGLLQRHRQLLNLETGRSAPAILGIGTYHAGKWGCFSSKYTFIETKVYAPQEGALFRLRRMDVKSAFNGKLVQRGVLQEYL